MPSHFSCMKKNPSPFKKSGGKKEKKKNEKADKQKNSTKLIFKFSAISLCQDAFYCTMKG